VPGSASRLVAVRSTTSLRAGAAVIGSALLAGCGGGNGVLAVPPPPREGLFPRPVQVGTTAIDVIPQRIDATGAAFTITVRWGDTPVAVIVAHARLSVGGNEWPRGPCADRTASTLQACAAFTRAGPAKGTAVLAIPDGTGGQSTTHYVTSVWRLPSDADTTATS
jgi:hypothetical protein